jgi:protein-S-isoprenylcysteine O-methyltransferase Ste14
MSQSNKKSHSHRRHEGRDDLAGECPWGDAGQLILLFLFLIVWVLDSFVFKLTTFPASCIPLWIRCILAAGFLILSFILAKKGLSIVFGEKRETAVVIDKGVFGLVRHPVYLGSMLFYPGLFLLTASLAAAGIWLIIVIFYNIIAYSEEKILLDRFGDEYIAYKKRVGMWIPRISRS